MGGFVWVGTRKKGQTEPLRRIRNLKTSSLCSDVSVGCYSILSLYMQLNFLCQSLTVIGLVLLLINL